MADIPTVSLDETSPVGSNRIRQGDDRIREYKQQNREVLEVDHDFPSSGTSATAGQHKQLTLQEAADVGTGAAGVPILGAQTRDGKPDLCLASEDDTDVYLTRGDKVDLDQASASNNTYIKAVDAAGTGEVDLIKADANDVAVVSDGIETATDTAPTSDKDLTNKKFVDDWHTTTPVADKAPQLDGDGRIPHGLNTVGVCRIVTGTYDGSGAASKAITGVGFEPKYLEISPLNNSYYGRYMKTSDIPTKYARSYAGYSDNMFQLDADGFTVYNNGTENYNRSGVTYAYVAIG